MQHQSVDHALESDGVVTPADLEVGDPVAVLFYRPAEFARPGAWDTLTGRVVSVGAARVCYAPTNPNLPADWGDDTPDLSGPDSPVRFVARDRCFPTPAAALEAAGTMKPPV